MAKEILTLQEKMVLIRRKIPALVKRAYSEEVAYDFTKIDDIFRFLTPAMNEYKVNFDIVSETATKRDENGSPVYVVYLGQNQFPIWMYEADLGIQWINAENPEDTSSMTLHAIGTHEMPEKAKGSAWTYSLKYYLLDKFCIDQGGEDSDMRQFQPVPEERFDNQYHGEEPEPVSENQELDVPEPEIEQADETGTGDYFQEFLAQSSNEPVRPERHTGIRAGNGQMVNLPEYVETTEDASARQSDSGTMTVEEACQVVCSCGLNKGKRLGDLARNGEAGIKALRWYANYYHGRDERLREGARVLLRAAEAA